MQQNEPTENQSAALADANMDKRIHEHLTNQQDVITEDDIRNAVTTIFLQPTSLQEAADF